MNTQIIIALSFFILMVIAIGWIKIRATRFKRRLYQLAKSCRLSVKNGDKETYPNFKLKGNWLFIKNFNPVVNQLHFDTKLLTSFSNLYEIEFLKAEYKNRSIVLKASRAKTLSFTKHHPKFLEPYKAFVGSKDDGASFILDTTNACSFLFGGGPATGKSFLCDTVHRSLVLSSGEAKTYVFSKNKNDFHSTDKTVFVPKDDRSQMLWHLKEIKNEVIERQKEIERANLRNGFEAKMQPIYIIADEVHSYGKLASSSASKEEKEEAAQIVQILKFLLLQGRSSVIYIFFIMPSLEKGELDFPVRESAFFFSTKITSEEVSNNLFGGPIAYLMKKETGLFAFTDKNQSFLIKVAGH